jgi:molybdopterin molybdotransferase
MSIDKGIITPEEAIRIILNSITPLPAESVDIWEAEGRILYDEVISNIDIPPFNNSAMDGYALISWESGDATTGNPVRLKIIDEIKAGEEARYKKLTSGCAIRIMTGAAIPAGADSVIQFEDTSEKNNTVNVYREVKPNENIRFAGEDLARNSMVFKKGRRISSADTGLLASLYYNEIRTYRTPEVAIVSTGNEIIDSSEDLGSGKIRNSNAYTLYSEIKKYHAIPHYMGIAADTKEDTSGLLKKAMKYNVILTTGGISMGRYDFVIESLKELGVDILIEKIKMKPGKPCVFGKKDDILFFGLPGNPVSTMVSFIQFVRPALLKLMGAERINKPIINAILKEDITKKQGRKHFLRGYFIIEDGEFHVSTTGPQGSGILRSMSMANCLIIVPEDVEKLVAGSRVSIELINHEEI